MYDAVSAPWVNRNGRNHTVKPSSNIKDRKAARYDFDRLAQRSVDSEVSTFKAPAATAEAAATPVAPLMSVADMRFKKRRVDHEAVVALKQQKQQSYYEAVAAKRESRDRFDHLFARVEGIGEADF